MLTTAVRVRLTVFAVVSVLVLSVTAVSYVRLPQLFGFGQFQVHADFADASGLYENGNVTYRGSSVGKIGALDVARTGVVVTLDIDNGSHIPADSVASIHSTSAVGEQYIDLIPGRGADAARTLHDGSTITRANTRELPSTSTLINSLDALFRSVPHAALGRVLDDVAVGLDRASPDAQRLLDDASALLDTAQRNFPQTRQLLRSLEPVLDTQRDLGASTVATVHDLATVSHQLVLSNDDLVRLIRDTPGLAKQIIGTERDVTPSLNRLLSALTTNGRVLTVYDPAVRQLLTIYPALLSGLIDFAQDSAPTGRIPLYFHLNLNDPPTCKKGFIPVDDRRDPSDTSSIETPGDLYCKEAPNSIKSVRGARNLPCLNNPGVRAGTPAACLGRGEPAFGSDAAVVTNSVTTTADRAVTPGQLVLPAPGAGDSWKRALLAPITR